jgi:hypothetical protein
LERRQQKRGDPTITYPDVLHASGARVRSKESSYPATNQHSGLTGGPRPDQDRGGRRRGWLLGYASESQVRLQVAADRAGQQAHRRHLQPRQSGTVGRSRQRIRRSTTPRCTLVAKLGFLALAGSLPCLYARRPIMVSDGVLVSVFSC